MDVRRRTLHNGILDDRCVHERGGSRALAVDGRD